MRNPFRRPSLFVSYAREDERAADQLREALTTHGFRIFFDTQETMIGEDFARRIDSELRTCDAVVAIVSRNSTESAWCQVEVGQAIAMKKPITPVLLGEEPARWPAPLELYLSSIQRVVAKDADAMPPAASAIARRLSFLRSYRWLRIGAVAAFASLAVWIGRTLPSQINAWTAANERRAVERRILDAGSVLQRTVVSDLVTRFGDDDALIASLLLMDGNFERTPIQRLNARLVADALLAPRSKRSRRYVEELDWESSDCHDGKIVDTTFVSGTLRDIRFRDTTFASVAWASGDTLSLSESSFERCTFSGGQFLGTKVLGVDFVNSIFHGTRFDLAEFAQVHFRSHSTTSNPSTIAMGQVSAFERCVIENFEDRDEPSEADQRLDFTTPDNEVRFTHVVFEGCTLRGTIRADWFDSCSFIDCRFPSATTRDALEGGNNNLDDDCHWLGN